MKRTIALLLGVFILSCGEEKKSLSGDQINNSEEFVESFPVITLPYTLNEEGLSQKPNDSLLINDKWIEQYIPDTVFSRDFNHLRPMYYAIGKTTDKNGDNYVLLHAYTSVKKRVYLLCFNKAFQFKASMLFLAPHTARGRTNESLIDRKFTIFKNSNHKVSEDENYYTRNVYVYNNVGTFTLIMRESNDLPEEEEVFNPINSLPALAKNSGDYVQDKRNFISIRDGDKPTKIKFFIHFEKPGDCEGELKGVAEMQQSNIAVYSAAGDPCMLEFQFQKNAIIVSELQGCGNHRGLKCFFSGTYRRKRIKAGRHP